MSFSNSMFLRAQRSVENLIKNIQHDKEFSDVTLSCGNASKVKFLQAHKVILAHSSTLFKQLLKNQSQNTSNGNVVLYLKGIQFEDLSSLLDFIYRGEVKVAPSNLTSFLSAANDLKVEVLFQQDTNPNNTEDEAPVEEENLEEKSNMEEPNEVSFIKSEDELQLPGLQLPGLSSKDLLYKTYPDSLDNELAGTGEPLEEFEASDASLLEKWVVDPDSNVKPKAIKKKRLKNNPKKTTSDDTYVKKEGSGKKEFFMSVEDVAKMEAAKIKPPKTPEAKMIEGNFYDGQIVRSPQGKNVLLMNGFRYTLNFRRNEFDNKKQIIHWRCWRRDCETKIITNLFDQSENDVRVQILEWVPHNHGEDKDKLRKSTFTEKLIKKIEECSDMAPTEIFNEFMSDIQNENLNVEGMPSYPSIRGTIKRTLRKMKKPGHWLAKDLEGNREDTE